MDEHTGDSVLSAVEDERRQRYLLYCLCLHTTPHPLAGIADQLAVWETGDPPRSRPDDRLEIYMSLYHDHLPELAEDGIVTYWQASDTVDWHPSLPRESVERRLQRDLQGEIDDLLRAETGTFEPVG